jgi:hypothetical protein
MPSATTLTLLVSGCPSHYRQATAAITWPQFVFKQEDGLAVAAQVHGIVRLHPLPQVNCRVMI